MRAEAGRWSPCPCPCYPSCTFLPDSLVKASLPNLRLRPPVVVLPDFSPIFSLD